MDLNCNLEKSLIYIVFKANYGSFTYGASTNACSTCFNSVNGLLFFENENLMLLFVWQFVPVNPLGQTQLEKAPFAWVKHEPPFKQGFGEHPFVVTVVFISHNCPVKPFATQIFKNYKNFFLFIPSGQTHFTEFEII